MGSEGGLPNGEDRWLDKRAASEYTGVSRSTMDERRRQGFFADDEWGRTGPGGHVRYKRSALDRMMKHFAAGGQVLVLRTSAAVVASFILLAVGCDVGPRWCHRGHPHTERPVAKLRVPDPLSVTALGVPAGLH